MHDIKHTMLAFYIRYFHPYIYLVKFKGLVPFSLKEITFADIVRVSQASKTSQSRNISTKYNTKYAATYLKCR